MKKYLKVAVVVALTIVMVFALVACGQKKEETKKTEKKAKAKTEQVATVTMEGTVLSVKDGVLTMDTATGNQFSFKIGNASVHCELTEGAPITVKFEGTEDQPGKLLKVY